ncbi:restriction endonuclease subunit S [Streptococcus salivarius]
MTRMKESGVDWIGQIPEEWEVIKFKYLGDVKQGLTYSPSDIVDKDEGILVLRSGNIQNGVLDFTNNVYVKTKVAESIVLRKNDILITARNGSSALIGKNAIIDTDIKATFGAFMMIFRTNKSLIAKFAFYLMNISFNFYRTFFTTSTVNQLTAAIFNGIEVPLPSISEQQKIADFLDKKTAQLDKAKALLEEQIQKLKDYSASLIYETVTKGLDKTVPMKDSGIDWIGQVPEGWGVSKLKNLLKIKDGTHDTPSYVDSGIPLITTKNINSFSNYIDFSTAKNISYKDYILINRRSDVEYGDILMPMIGTVGGAVQVTTKNSFSIKNVALFKAGFDLIMSKYLYYQLNSALVNNQLEFLMSGGVQSFVSISILEQLQIINPSDKDKKKIVRFLDKKTQKINKLIQIKNQQIENIDKQRQTLIYDYVTGKRRV